MEREPVARCSISESAILNVCSHREQSFKRQNQHDGEGREAAKTSRSVMTKTMCAGLVSLR
jgi:hypothetical protein